MDTTKTRKYGAQKEYARIERAKKNLDTAWRLFFARLKVPHYISHGEDLRSLARLKLKGGPKDLSQRLKFYLYRQ